MEQLVRAAIDGQQANSPENLKKNKLSIITIKIVMK